MIENLHEYIAKDIKSIIGSEANDFVVAMDPLSFKIPLDSLITVLKFLRDNHSYKFKILIDLFVVDYPSRPKRFEVNYNLLSISSNYRINLKVELNDGEGAPSIAQIFSTAQWLEREAWDMYGVKFSGNSDLRRILTDYGFEGHPMRKDFPLTGYREVKYDAKKGKVVYEDVSLTQEYREFDFETPWSNTNSRI